MLLLSYINIFVFQHNITQQGVELDMHNKDVPSELHK